MPRDILIGILAPLSILLPIGMFIYKKKHPYRPAKIIFYYLLAAGFINIIAILLIKLRMRNLPLLHVYTIIETLFFLFYFKSIFQSQKIKKALTFFAFAFPVLCVINFLFIQSIFTFNTYTRPLEAILITFFCLLYFYKTEFKEDWLATPVHWFNMGIMVYFPTASIIFILSNYFVFKSYDKELNTIIWNIHAMLVVVMYLFFTKGFSLLKKTEN